MEGEDYIAAEDGDDIILTIDMTIQSIAEKYLKQACIDNACTDGGNVIIMNPKTGDILAMATYPNYDLNSPYEINNEELKSVWDTLSGGEKSNYLLQMWRNKAISDTYEPGSTFKLVTSSAALQEGITDTDRAGEFHCSGSITIAGARIKCWRYYRPHGSQSLRQALMNSCNPVFIGIGQKLGIHTYYSYLDPKYWRSLPSAGEVHMRMRIFLPFMRNSEPSTQASRNPKSFAGYESASFESAYRETFIS